jgi:hypothetical protein
MKRKVYNPLDVPCQFPDGTAVPGREWDELEDREGLSAAIQSGRLVEVDCLPGENPPKVHDEDEVVAASEDDDEPATDSPRSKRGPARKSRSDAPESSKNNDKKED